MRRLYIVTGDDVRREPATVDEVRRTIEGRAYHSGQLARVTLDDDGRIVATPLTADELRGLAAEMTARMAADLCALLDASRRLCDDARDIEGVSWTGSAAIVVWPETAPWTEDVVREWAAKNGLEVHDEAPPTDPRLQRRWIRTAGVTVRGRDIVRMQWPAVDLGETAVAVEAMSIGIAAVYPDVAF